MNLSGADQQFLAGAVADTDKTWFDHFAFPSESVTRDEVNFWRPASQQRFKALATGEPLFFRLKHPRNAIAGFGFFAVERALRPRAAWDVFGDKNGDPTFEHFERRLNDYRRRLRGGDIG